MISIAFTFSTNGLYVCALQGDKVIPDILFKSKMSLPNNYSAPELVEWFETELNLILNKVKPNNVTYKLTINNITNSFVSKVYYGQAILNLLCIKKDIPVSHTSPSAIVQSKFGLAKTTSLHDFIDAILSNPGTPWDAKMRDTALMALNILV